MARAAILETILADQRMQALGLDDDSVVVNYDGEQRPEGVGPVFLVLAWSSPETALRGDDIWSRRFMNLTIWAHILRDESTDFVRLDKILDDLDDILLNMVHVAGTDGYTVSLVESAGRSRDMRDDAYQTICRSVSYRILSRETASV